MYASGRKALLLASGVAAIVDASKVSEPILKRTAPLQLGYPFDVHAQDGTVLLSFGEMGLLWIDL